MRRASPSGGARSRLLRTTPFRLSLIAAALFMQITGMLIIKKILNIKI